jgi:hypothetical protein
LDLLILVLKGDISMKKVEKIGGLITADEIGDSKKEGR